jgi:hypothetical protein
LCERHKKSGAKTKARKAALESLDQWAKQGGAHEKNRPVILSAVESHAKSGVDTGVYRN